LGCITLDETKINEFNHIYSIRSFAINKHPDGATYQAFFHVCLVDAPYVNLECLWLEFAFRYRHTECLVELWMA